MHLCDVGGRVKVVSVGEAPVQLLGERTPDRGLAYTTYSHEDDDHSCVSLAVAVSTNGAEAH